jgi:hypothetical protein
MKILKIFSAFPLLTRIGLAFGGMILVLHLQLIPETTQTLHPPVPSGTPSNGCIELRPDSGPYQEASILKPGRYCITVDFWQYRLSNGAGHSGPAPYRHLIGIKGGDVSIDMVNHILHSDGHSSGIYAATMSNRGSAMYTKSNYGHQTRNINIKNGVIDLRGLGTGVVLINQWDMHRIDAETPENMRSYEKSNFVLENLLIKTDNIGIILEGEGNIVRNCIIESGGSAAISMAGPGGKIINNTIILKNPIRPGSMSGINFWNFETRNIAEFMKERLAPKAAIALHQANGTIISGNRIEVMGSSASRHSIYLTDSSRDVHIEGNTIIEKSDTVTLAKGSTAVMKNNVFKLEKR